MANDPKAAAKKRSQPADRKNAQGDHEGSPHSPEEFLRTDGSETASHPPTKPAKPTKP